MEEDDILLSDDGTKLNQEQIDLLNRLLAESEFALSDLAEFFTFGSSGDMYDNHRDKYNICILFNRMQNTFERAVLLDLIYPFSKHLAALDVLYSEIDQEYVEFVKNKTQRFDLITKTGKLIHDNKEVLQLEEDFGDKFCNNAFIRAIEYLNKNIAQEQNIDKSREILEIIADYIAGSIRGFGLIVSDIPDNFMKVFRNKEAAITGGASRGFYELGKSNIATLSAAINRLPDDLRDKISSAYRVQVQRMVE